MQRVYQYIISVLLILTIPAFLIAKETDIYWTSSAGQWFPANSTELVTTVDGYLNKAMTASFNGEIVALISPHAGYPYSGPIAAYAYKQLEKKQFDTVILLGLSHHYPLNNASIYDQGIWQSPLGKLEIDTDLAKDIEKITPTLIKFIPEAFQGEHSVENQIPFLQRTLKQFKIVPILVNRSELAEPLAKAIITAINKQKSKKILIVASTDLSHLQYPKLEEAKKTDDIALTAMQKLDPTGMKGIPCGEAGVETALLVSKSLGAKRGILLKYGNSYNTTQDLSWVVGYGAVAIIKSDSRLRGNDVIPAKAGTKSKIEQHSAIRNPQSAISLGLLTATKQTTETKRWEPQLDERAQKELLKLARNTLDTYIRLGNTLEFKPMNPVLEENWGAFVTLTENDALRGCIGHFGRDLPLYQIVKEMTIAAATQDPRFSPVKVTELSKIKIKISVLSGLKEISDVNEIIVGKHGVYIRSGYRGGTYLPEVAVEQGWTRTQMLEHLCAEKAMLPKDAWKDKNTQIFIYTSQIFGEK
jgi:AmmeMemoRadiSam system protein B/AmmeMemoRadiSam system protein A